MKKTFLSGLLCLLVTVGFSQIGQKQSGLQTAQWIHTKKKAELNSGNTTYIKIEFGKKTTAVKFENENFELSKKGFWNPQIIIKQKDIVDDLQKNFVLVGTKRVLEIDGKKYFVKTKYGRLTKITYSNEYAEILTYKLDASRRRPLITYEIKATDIPEQHLLLLLAFGFYIVRNESMDSVAAILL